MLSRVIQQIRQSDSNSLLAQMRGIEIGLAYLLVSRQYRSSMAISPVNQPRGQIR